MSMSRKLSTLGSSFTSHAASTSSMTGTCPPRAVTVPAEKREGRSDVSARVTLCQSGDGRATASNLRYI